MSPGPPPSESTTVRILNVPDRTTYLFLAAGSESGVQEIREWHTTEVSWDLEGPQGVYDGQVWHGRYERHVPWPDKAARIGVVAGNNERRWRVYWFPWSAPGAGDIEFNLATCAQVEVIADPELERMGVRAGLCRRHVNRLASGQRWTADDIEDLSLLFEAAERQLATAAESIRAGSLHDALSRVAELFDLLDDRCQFDQWPEPEASTLEAIFAAFLEIRDGVDEADAAAAGRAVERMAALFRRLFASP